MTDQKQNVPQQPKVEADMEERIQNFNNELRPLLGKYELGLAAMPEITQDGRILARPIIVSVRKKETETNDEAPKAPVEKPELENPEA